MDKTIKVLLGIIATGLVALNLQLAGIQLVEEARADIYGSDIGTLSKSLDGIAKAIRGLGEK